MGMEVVGGCASGRDERGLVCDGRTVGLDFAVLTEVEVFWKPL